MKTDITLRCIPKAVTDADGNERKDLIGHYGTHFDVRVTNKIRTRFLWDGFPLILR